MHLIAPTGRWLDEALTMPGSHTFGIVNDNTPIGLVSWIDPNLSPEVEDIFLPECAYLWRIMIDSRFQGRGVGSCVLTEMLARAGAAGFSGMSLTTKDKADGNALAFYLNRGFVPSGRRLRGEIELVKFFGGC